MKFLKLFLGLCMSVFLLLSFGCQKPVSSLDLEEDRAELLMSTLYDDPSNYETKCVDGLPYMKCTTTYNPDGTFKSFDCEMEWNAEHCYIIKKEDDDSDSLPPPPNEWPSNALIYNITGSKISDFTNYFAPIKAASNNGSNAQIRVYVKSPAPFNQVMSDWSSGESDVGESFISISVNGHTRVFGFFPLQPMNPNSFVHGPSTIIDKSGGDYDLELVFGLSNSQLQTFINKLESSYISNNFSIRTKSDATLIRDLLWIIKPSFVFSNVPYPNNIGTGIGSNSGYLAHDIDSKSYEFNTAIYNNSGGTAGVTK